MKPSNDHAKLCLSDNRDIGHKSCQLTAAFAFSKTYSTLQKTWQQEISLTKKKKKRECLFQQKKLNKQKQKYINKKPIPLLTSKLISRNIQATTLL